ncbi:MAG: rhodanese-like domain-containing protein [Rhodospirillales bacterium]|jgi:thiosulfate sulfurtransferase
MTRIPKFLTPTALARSLASDGPPVVVDVRRVPAFEADPHGLPGALRGEPDRIEDWSRHLPANRSVVVYCVHGHEVSQGAAATLSAAGLDILVLGGGIAGWRAAGHAVVPAATLRPVRGGRAP